MSKTKGKERILKADKNKKKKKKQLVACKENPLRPPADFSETLQPRRDWDDIDEALQRKRLPTQNTLSRKDVLRKRWLGKDSPL